jgi:hypothetical protein
MAMGKKRWRQQAMWIASQELPRTRGHIFYDRVNEILKGEKLMSSRRRNASLFIRVKREADRASHLECISEW